MNLEEAGEFFKSYGCNLYYASREGDYSKLCMYNYLNITKEQELIWTEEYIKEHCDMIANNKESATNLGLYLAPYKVIYTLIQSQNLYSLCDSIINTIDYAINNLNPYERISIADYICNRNYNDDNTIFINIVAKANKTNTNIFNKIDLIDKLSEKFNDLLNMQVGNKEDFYDEKYRDRIIKQFELQLSDVKSGKVATEHKVR